MLAYIEAALCSVEALLCRLVCNGEARVSSMAIYVAAAASNVALK